MRKGALRTFHSSLSWASCFAISVLGKALASGKMKMICFSVYRGCSERPFLLTTAQSTSVTRMGKLLEPWTYSPKNFVRSDPSKKKPRRGLNAIALTSFLPAGSDSRAARLSSAAKKWTSSSPCSGSPCCSSSTGKSKGFAM